jgi:hypothetical protein
MRDPSGFVRQADSYNAATRGNARSCRVECASPGAVADAARRLSSEAASTRRLRSANLGLSRLSGSADNVTLSDAEGSGRTRAEPPLCATRECGLFVAVACITRCYAAVDALTTWQSLRALG